MKRNISALAILLVVLIANLIWWVLANQPVTPKDSRYPIYSLSFNPYQRHHDPFARVALAEDELRRDLEKVATKTNTIRLYTSMGGMEHIPRIASEYELRVIASAWLDRRTDNNINEVEAAIKLASENANIIRVILGNETQLHNNVPREELIGHLNKARRRLRTAVSTAEPWDFWINNPEFVEHVDFIAIHILPYWQEVPVDRAVDYVIEKYRAVRERFPDKMVMIAETGWPSDGPQRGGAEATLANQAKFIREFIRRAGALRIPYNIIEAFDQPWKYATEGRAGEHFGIMDAFRNEKFSLAGAVLEDPNWRFWALLSTLIGALSIGFFFLRKHKIKSYSKLFAAIIIQGAVSLSTLLAQTAAGEYMSASEIVFWSIMLTAQALLAIIILTDTAEIADVVGRKPLKRRFTPLDPARDKNSPMVSIHLACCSEPPALVIATLDSLAELDYPNYEVIVVDNNTTDESLWRPVELHCQKLGPRFRFFSLGKWPGYKAGALNFALRQTAPAALYVGVVDADYVVRPEWLRATVPYFENASVAVVQAPQEHRGWEGNLFQQMENDEYSGFFRIGMVQRNEDNAIIQHGTMTLIRKQALADVNGWAEWCICEDAELGLRLLNAGHEVLYIDHAFGWGLVPDSFGAYAKQRFRWAYGGMRILRHYFPELLGLRGELTTKQRYHFIRGWLPWIGDGLHMLFTICALGWSAKLIANPLHTDFPEQIFIYPALALIGLRLLGTVWTYRSRVHIGTKRTLLAMCAGGALTHKIAKAVVQGLLTRSKPFYRTPKMATAPRLVQALLDVWEELALGLLLVGSAVLILIIFGFVNDDAVLWASALVLQGLPYYAAVATSLIAAKQPPFHRVESQALLAKVEHMVNAANSPEGQQAEQDRVPPVHPVEDTAAKTSSAPAPIGALNSDDPPTSPTSLGSAP